MSEPSTDQIKEVKRALNINDEDIAQLFGYKNRYSYANSPKKPWIENGIIEIYNRTRTAETPEEDSE